MFRALTQRSQAYTFANMGHAYTHTHTHTHATVLACAIICRHTYRGGLIWIHSIDCLKKCEALRWGVMEEAKVRKHEFDVGCTTC